jgi:hypothetical protein
VGSIYTSAEGIPNQPLGCLVPGPCGSCYERDAGPGSSTALGRVHRLKQLELQRMFLASPWSLVHDARVATGEKEKKTQELRNNKKEEEP